MITRRNLIASLPAVTLAASLGAALTTPAVAANLSGSFEGRSNHVTSGTARIIEEGGRRFVELGEDFSLDGGPDPRVALGINGEYDPETYLGALLDLNGKQRYAIPPTWDISKHNTVVIWCEVASVPLGVAAVN